MTPIAIDPARVDRQTEFGASGVSQPDRLRHVVHVALAIYLIPVVAVVCAIGLISIAAGKAAGAVGRLTIKRPRAEAGPTRNIRP